MTKIKKIIIFSIICIFIVGSVFVYKKWMTIIIFNLQAGDISTWQTYNVKNSPISFKYPKNILINESTPSFKERTGTSYVSFHQKNNESEFLVLGIFHRAAYKEPRQTLAYSEWKYFVDNFDDIKSGSCSDKIRELIDNSYWNYKKCNITKNSNFIALETEKYSSYYTPKIQINSYITNENKEIRAKILSTLEFK